MKWSAYATERIDCIVRPCVQNPWYCLHSPDQCFLHGMILLSWRPKNWKIKKRRCLHGRSERDRGRSAARMCVCACVLTGRLTPSAWRSVCSLLLMCSVFDCDSVELAVLSRRASRCDIMCNVVLHPPTHPPLWSRVAPSDCLSLPVVLVHPLLSWHCVFAVVILGKHEKLIHTID